MGRLILVSNRLPLTVKSDKNTVTVVPSAGGLVTGLRGPHERSNGFWVGWPGDMSRLRAAQRATLDAQLAAQRFVPVALSAAEVSRFYDGFSNAVIWPLFHYLLDRIPLEPPGWDMYQYVNEKFADVVAAQYQPGDVIWVHDYQLMLVPALLRQRLPSARIGFFLHIPFPASEVLRTLPSRAQILEGMLGADLIGFHTHTYLRHFSSSVMRILGIATHGDDVRHAGRETRLGTFAMGIDTKSFTALAQDEAVIAELQGIRAACGGQRMLLGIDRLDYTKGIPRRLLAFERLLERQPRHRGRVQLVQIAVPSRDKVESYQDYRRQVDELVGRINGAFGTVDWVPIHYVLRSLTDRHVVALYRAADVMLVTPLRDGMNLVAKEFVTCRTDEDGVLVLSEFAGAAAEMGEAVQVNPYDVDALASAYEVALTMPKEERRFRMRALRSRILSRDVHLWARSFIDTLASCGERASPEQKLSTREEIDNLSLQLRSSHRLLLLLDYDGTLVPFARAPELAVPDGELVALLAKLAARPNTELHVVSGRTHDTLDRWLGALPIGLHAEHGFWSRGISPREPWAPLFEPDVAWKETVRPLLAGYTNTTPGSLLEEKTVSFAWHYRMAEPELAASRGEELVHDIEAMAREPELPLELLLGDHVIEVRLRGVSKATVVERVLRATEPPLPVVCAMGDDLTDDDMFRALPADAIAVSVGFHASGARYRVARPALARALLRSLV